MVSRASQVGPKTEQISEWGFSKAFQVVLGVVENHAAVCVM